MKVKYWWATNRETNFI